MRHIRYEKESNIATITISREEALNALNSDVMQELKSTLEKVELDKDVYCLILTGGGDKAFVAGADVNEMKDMNLEEAKELATLGNAVFRKIETLSIPVIAAINGYALGGGLELALACDIRIASTNALFGFPETGLGIMPGYGGTQRLPRTIGIAKAKRMIYSGLKIKSEEALRIGLVEEVVSKESLMDAANKLAGTIASNAPIAVSYCKEAISSGLEERMYTALKIETELFSRCFSTEDQKSAMLAFVNKTKLDKFKNR